MSTAVKLPDGLVYQAKVRAKAMARSTARQIEYWAKVGQIAEDNPDLPFNLIKDIMISLHEKDAGEVTPYWLDK